MRLSSNTGNGVPNGMHATCMQHAQRQTLWGSHEESTHAHTNTNMHKETGTRAKVKPLLHALGARTKEKRAAAVEHESTC